MRAVDRATIRLEIYTLIANILLNFKTRYLNLQRVKLEW